MGNSKSEKNPLSQMFGAFLRIKRNSKGYNSLEMAKKLNLGTSYYRMIEAGSFSLNPNRIFLLKEILQEDFIDPERGIKYFIGVQYVQYYMDSKKTPEDAIKLFSQINDDFKKFYHIVEPFFYLKEDSREQKVFLETTIVNEVSNFLTEKYYASSKTEQFENKLITKIQDTPSLTLELVLDFIHALKQHPPMHISKYAEEWEETNKHRFLTLKGVYKKAEYIICAENLERFYYPYLFEENFKQLHFIFLDKIGNEKKIKKEFIDILNPILKKHNLPKLTVKQTDKISFKYLPDISNYTNEMNGLLKGEDKIISDSKAFWVFSTEKGNQIGFIASPQGDGYQVLNLTYKETIERSKIFDIMWEGAK